MKTLSIAKEVIMRTVIIGASFSGVSCALMLKRWDVEGEVVLFDKQELVPYIPNGLNWFFRKEISTLSDARFIRSNLLSEQGIDCRLGCQVVGVDYLNQSIKYVVGDRIEQIIYDNLVFATGSSAKSHVIEGIDSSRVVVTKGYEESLEAQSVLKNAQTITIIGGGPIGIEASETLVNLGKKVILVESGPSLDFKNVDPEMTIDLKNRMRDLGIELRLSTRVRKIEDNGDHFPLLIESNQSQWQSDAVLLAVNFRPETHLYRDDLTCLVDGTLEVDEFMRTSVPNVYAVGDVVQLPFMSSHDKRYMPLVNHAIRSAEVAASYILGVKRPLLPSYKIIGHCHFGLYRGRIGLTEEEMIFSNHAYRTYLYENKEFGRSLNHFICLKIITHQETGEFLGLQCLSDYNCLELLNVMSLILRSKMSIDDVIQQDFYYPVHNVNVVAELQKACQEMSRERRQDAD